jgi:Putative adhesin
MTTLTPMAAPAAATPERSPHARAAWTGAGLFTAVVIVLWLVLSTLGAVAYQTIPTSQRVFAGTLTAVTVDVGTGSVTVERNAGPDTVVTTSGSRGLTWPTDEEHVSGSSLTIRSRCRQPFFGDHCNRNYVLHVQPATSLTVTTGEGTIDVGDIGGALSLNSGQGDVTIAGGGGALRVFTGEGNVSATGLRAQSVSARSGQGDIDLGFTLPPARVSASSGQGNVTIGLPNGSTLYQVHVDSGEGIATNGVAESLSSPRVIDASTGQGDVAVGYGAG